MGMNMVVVTAETREGRCSACRRQWRWWIRLVQVCINVQEILSGACTRGRTAQGRRRGGAGEAETAREAYGVFLGVSKDKGKE